MDTSSHTQMYNEITDVIRARHPKIAGAYSGLIAYGVIEYIEKKFAYQPVAAAPAAQAATIPTWQERAQEIGFTKGRYPDTDEVEQMKAAEIAELRAALQQRQAPAPVSARDWIEDAPHENGNYQCLCSTCGNTFIGHKRRVTCKACAQQAEAAPVASAEPIYQARQEQSWAWTDVSRDVWEFVEPARRRVVYSTAQAAPAPADEVLEQAVEAADSAYLTAQCSIERGEFSMPVRQTREAIENAIRAVMSRAAPAPVAAVPVAWIRTTDITELTDSEPETEGWTPLFAAPVASQPAQSEQTQQSDRDSALRAEPAGQQDADPCDVIDFALELAEKGDAYDTLGFLQAWNWESVEYLRATWPEFAEFEAASRCRAEGGDTKSGEVGRDSQPAGGEEAKTIYTCVGKGGKYRLLGTATGAGTSRDLEDLRIYIEADNPLAMYYRTIPNFDLRMAVASDAATPATQQETDNG